MRLTGEQSERKPGQQRETIAPWITTTGVTGSILLLFIVTSSVCFCAFIVTLRYGLSIASHNFFSRTARIGWPVTASVTM